MQGDPLLMFVSWFGYFDCDFLCLHQKHESASVCCKTQHHFVFHSSEICSLDSKLNVWSVNVLMTLFMFIITEPGCHEAWPAQCSHELHTHTNSHTQSRHIYTHWITMMSRQGRYIKPGDGVGGGALFTPVTAAEWHPENTQVVRVAPPTEHAHKHNIQAYFLFSVWLTWIEIK